MKHAADVRRSGVALVADGLSYSEAARRLDVGASSIWRWCAEERRRQRLPRPTIGALEPGTNIAGIIIDDVLGHRVRPGLYERRPARNQSQIDRVCYRVHCAVCGAGMAPVSHRRLVRLQSEYDVVNCVQCWKKGSRRIDLFERLDSNSEAPVAGSDPAAGFTPTAEH